MKKILYILLLLSLYSQSQSLSILERLRQEQSVEGDPLLISGLQMLLDETSIDPTAVLDGDSVSTWDDVSGNSIDAGLGIGAAALLNIEGSQRQVSFFNTNGWLSLGNPAALNFVGGVDEFTMIIKIGETPSTQGYWISKATALGVDRQWGIYNFGARVATYLRGVDSDLSAEQVNQTIATQDLVIWTVSTTLQNVTVNNANALVDFAVTTANASVTTHDAQIGTRSSGGFMNNGDIVFIAIYDRVLTPSELTAIRAVYNK